jgi:hypothetical protein
MKITESLGRWDQIIAGVAEHKEQWAEEAPAHA